MDDFRKIESQFDRVPVTLVDFPDAKAVLWLSGGKTRLRVTSETTLKPSNVDSVGFFNLRARTRDGNELLLYKCVFMRRWSYGWHEEFGHLADIYPNIVVDNTKALVSGDLVESLSFSLVGMNIFFYYQYIETFSSFSADPANLQALRALRRSSACRVEEKDDQIFDPSYIYISHNFPIFFSFKIEGRTYRVWAGGVHSNGSWDRLDSHVHPVADIIFDEPVTIDDALDHAWTWRRLFCQLTLSPHRFKYISITSRVHLRPQNANLYLPNLKYGIRKKEKKRGDDPSPAQIPYSFWADREECARAMENWLRREPQRREFRANINRVISRFRKRIDPRDIVDLVSAVDSLTEIKGKDIIKKEDIAKMADAALRESPSDFGLPRERMIGLLGSLGRKPISYCLNELAKAVRPAMDQNDALLLVARTTGLRNKIAHGGSYHGEKSSVVAAIIIALTALCVRYDLETSGFPSLPEAGQMTWVYRQFSDAIDMVKTRDVGT